jgi:glyoxylase-like metal-dependent hydrolase (beta-lactamase superfamily II)
MPPRAIGIPVNYTKGYGLIHLAAGAYFLQDAILPFNVIFWVSTEGVILWDISLTPAKITAAIREVTNLPIKVLIYSHSHADHIGNARDVIAEWGIQRVIAHHFINRTLTSWRDPRRPPPTESFRKAMTLTLGNQTVELTYKGEQHEEGNIWGWHQASKTLILFDVIYPGYVPVRGAPVTDFEGFLEAMNKTLEYDFDFYVGGHVNRPGTRDDVLKQIEFFNDVFVTIRDYSNQIPLTAVFPIIGPSTDTWKAFATYTELVNEDCFCRLAPKWKCVLGGFENYTRTACYLMSHYVRMTTLPIELSLKRMYAHAHSAQLLQRVLMIVLTSLLDPYC